MEPYDLTGQLWHELDEDLRQLRLRLAAAALFLLAVTLVGVLGYRTLAPGTSWIDAFYMTAITLTTVGFGEIVDLSANPAGRIFTVFLILTGMGGVLYFVSTATAFVLEGQIGHVFRRRRMQKILDSLHDHVIVCGSGATAIYTARELTSVKRRVVVVVEHPEEKTRVRAELGDLPVIVGDPASDDILEAAGVRRAAGIVACTDNDKENLVVTLSARQLNPEIRIVSRVRDIDAAGKIRKVGANSVVSPNYIGGLRLASELIRPTVVTFLDTMLRDRDANLRIDEITLPTGAPGVGGTLEELELPERSRALLLAVRRGDGTWRYNPPADLEVTPDLVLILLGSPEDIRTLCDDLGGRVVSEPVPGQGG